MTFPGLFAELAKGYMEHHGLSLAQIREMFAHVSALSYRNGFENPLAHFSKGAPPHRLGVGDPKKIIALPESGKGSNPMITYPLRLHDCSLISDGAAALVLAPTESAVRISSRSVEISGIGTACDRLSEKKRGNLYELTAGKVAVQKSFAEAGISINEVDFAEVHDCFSIHQLLTTEALGLSGDGRAGFDYMDGRFGPEDLCPVNLSGGLKAKGHPVGATGASMHALAFKQLVGEPIGMAPGGRAPETGVVFNVGGSGATNCVTVLKRLK